MARPGRPRKDFRRSLEYDQLLENQKAFVEAYLANGQNLIEAVKAAYSTTSDRSMRSLGARLLKTPSIRRLLLSAGVSIPGGIVATKADLIRLVSERLLTQRLSIEDLHRMVDDWCRLTGFDEKREKALFQKEQQVKKHGASVNAVLERLERGENKGEA